MDHSGAWEERAPQGWSNIRAGQNKVKAEEGGEFLEDIGIETLDPPWQTPHCAGLPVHVDCGVDAERCGSTSLLSVAGAVKPLRSFEPILSTQGALGRLTI
jgi:hypothetical protein